ncbi:MAG: DUF4388 domain-containing protein [Chloroflexota bacterium]|nr:DUF4388 domain-containing protein [Chloroflexota bacterium]
MEQQDRIMDGDLQTLGFQSVLKMLALSGKTGTLFVYSGPETLTISLRKGQIVALHEDGVPQPDLLMMLCLVNKLDPPRAQAIREYARGNEQVALSVLVERGWMSATEMQRRLEFSVTQSISHALRWVDGRFAFHRQVITMESKMELDIDSVLLEALRQADEWEEMKQTYLTRTTVTRWLPEITNDVQSLGLSQEYIEVLCLSNGELPLQAIALVLMMPEARIARIMLRLLEIRLIEVVNTALEADLQRDLSNIIIRGQTTLARQQGLTNTNARLLGLISIFASCINEFLLHHGKYAKSLRGRGQVPEMEVIRYLERRFGSQIRLLAKQQYPILETAEFSRGQLDCNAILTLNKLVKGEQLEEFYWEAVLGLLAFLRMIFAELLRDEVGNSHTGHQLDIGWKAFISEIDQEIQDYQVYRAYRAAQTHRGREAMSQGMPGVQPSVPNIGIVQNQNWNSSSENNGGPLWPPETRRRSI